MSCAGEGYARVRPQARTYHPERRHRRRPSGWRNCWSLGGERTAAAEGKTFEVVEPATAEPMAEVAEAGPEDARRAVDVAVRAFEEGAWPRTSARERGRVLTKASFLIRERQEDLARLEARNGGKPINAARGEIDLVANVFEYWGGAANKIFGETIPIVPPGIDVTLREPVGVCALITPWNFPAVIASWKIAPGARVRQHGDREARVADPADRAGDRRHPGRGRVCPTGRSPSFRVRAPRSPARSSPIPASRRSGSPGSTEVGHQGDAGGREQHHPRLARAGRQVRQRRLRRRRPGRVRREVDLVRVRQRGTGLLRPLAHVRRASRSTTSSSSGSRSERRRSWSGEPLDEATEMGPLISSGQRQTSLDYLRLGVDEGARRVTGRRRPRAARVLPAAGGARRRPQRHGASRRRRSSARSRASCPFETEEEAIRLANDSPYGLVGLGLDAEPRSRRSASRRASGRATSA